MPNLKETKKRILSVKNTQKITRAMKLVSSAKYARTHKQLLNSWPYVRGLGQMAQTLVKLLGNQEDPQLLENRDERSVLVILITPDRGLCGALNAKFIKETQKFVSQKKSQGVAVEYWVWGKRAQLFAKKQKENPQNSRDKVIDRPSSDFCLEMAEVLCKQFVGKIFDKIYIAHNESKNVLTQQPKIWTLLPALQESLETDLKDLPLVESKEPNLLDQVLKKWVGAQLYRVVLESAVSEHAARMTAMDNATNNAQDVIKTLTLEYNQARQAAITTELIEITSGAEAL